MQHGAVDYVQKPFTEDELTQFAQRLLIKRQARLAAAQRPTVVVAPPARAEKAQAHEYCIPGGAFLSPGHVWVRIEESGRVRVGLDDFLRKALGPIESVLLPTAGQQVESGDVLVTLKSGTRQAHLRTPLPATIVAVNDEAQRAPDEIAGSPYGRGWLCVLQPRDLAAGLAALRIGQPAVEWYHAEVERLRRSAPADRPALPVEDWSAFERDFLRADSK
jgi:glycine cleavage system H lipoate-binding protein